MKRGFHCLLAVFIIIPFTACSTTKLTNSWLAPDHKGPAYKNILVIGMSQEPGVRRSFEQQFANKLSSKSGVKGVESASMLRIKGELKNEDIIAVIKKTNVDAVLITHLVAEKKQKRYVPPQPVYAPSVQFGLYDYYHATYPVVYSPGYVTEDTIVKLETNVYSAATEKLIWSGTTESFNAGSAGRIIDELSNIVISQLASHKLI